MIFYQVADISLLLPHLWLPALKTILKSLFLSAQHKLKMCVTFSWRRQCLSVVTLPHSHVIHSDFALSIYRLSNSQSINIQILGTTTILMIANVTDEDYGNYTCVASNRLGVQNASLFLYSKHTFLYSSLTLVG